MWYTSRVMEGSKLGRTIGFPTLNLDSPNTLKGTPEGVYAARIRIGEDIYSGALYYGPRLVLNETKVVLEIHVFHFSKEIYGTIIQFEVGQFIRPVLNFETFDQLKSQLESDCDKIKSLLEYGDMPL